MDTEKRFAEKTAVITGAARGIGRACAFVFAERGANLVLVDVDGEKLASVGEEMKPFGTDVMTAVCDISNEQAVNDAAKAALERFGKVDMLVNNAALFRSWHPFTKFSSAEWERYFSVNVMGTAYCTNVFLPGMLERGSGSVVNVASVAGVYGLASMVMYSATKGAVIAMTRALAKETADKGVRINAVSPGSVNDSNDPDIDATSPSELSFSGRTGSDRENAELIAFLSSDKASYINGQNIQIDGCRKKQ